MNMMRAVHDDQRENVAIGYIIYFLKYSWNYILWLVIR